MAEHAAYSDMHKLTYLEVALAEQLQKIEQPVITTYQLFHELRTLYMSGRKLYARKSLPDREDLRRRRYNLESASVLAPDRDYTHRAYRILGNSDRAAEEIACIVDRFCYIAHLSAMARYGLTDRRPEALHLSTPHKRILPELVRQAMIEDYGANTLEELDDEQVMALHGVGHPAKLRKRPLAVFATAHPGRSIPLRGTYARIASIGQTFADMLEEPAACGGMRHVLEVWHEHASIYLEDIIAVVDKRPKGVTKVRAGYILEEYLGLTDSRIDAWTQFAQRGGSRVLDPHAPFARTYSEKWMLSLNVQR